MGVAAADEEDDGADEKREQGGTKAEGEVGAVADGANESGRWGVAEQVDEQHLGGEGGGSNAWRHGVDGSGVDRPGTEKDKKQSQRERGQGEGAGMEKVGAKEQDECREKGGTGAEAGHEKQRAAIGVLPTLRDGTAEDGAK